MFEITGRELASVCQGKWLREVCQGSSPDRLTFSGVSIDSRTVKKGDVFFAIPGDNFNGHDFIGDALKAGAAAAVAADPGPYPGPILFVKDTLKALQQTATWWRQKFSIPVAAITGSSGKTTTKDILASLLSVAGRVHCSAGNQNNEIGVPLTLLGLTWQHDVCVLEMGMRGLGEIAELCAVAHPTCGIITNVGSTHYERLGSIENIARAKGELAQCLSAGDFLLLNAENQWSAYIGKLSEARCILYGLGEKADIRASEIDYHSEFTEFTLTAKGVSRRLRVPLWGEHNIYNCLAAIGAYLCMGFPQELLQKGLDNLTVTEMRLEKTTGIKGSVIINDAYNANPSSMLASLNVLRQVEGKRRIAVLGDMFELGEIAESEHRKVGEAVAEAGVDLLVTVGSLAALIGEQALYVGMEKSKIFHCPAVFGAVDYLRKSIQEGDVVLVKGSRGMKMEQIVAALQAQEQGHV